MSYTSHIFTNTLAITSSSHHTATSDDAGICNPLITRSLHSSTNISATIDSSHRAATTDDIEILIPSTTRAFHSSISNNADKAKLFFMHRSNIYLLFTIYTLLSSKNRRKSTLLPHH